jgi:hypothetical protein
MVPCGHWWSPENAFAAFESRGVAFRGHWRDADHSRAMAIGFQSGCTRDCTGWRHADNGK